MKKIFATLMVIMSLSFSFSFTASAQYYMMGMKVGGSWRYIPVEDRISMEEISPKPLKDILKEFEERQNSFLVRTIIDEENTLQIFAVKRHPRVFPEDYLKFTPEELFKKESMIILSIPKKLDKLDLKAL